MPRQDIFSTSGLTMALDTVPTFEYGMLVQPARRVIVPYKAQGIYSISSTKRYPLGSKLDLGDRVFRYALVGTIAAVAGKLYEAPAKGGAAGTNTIEGKTVPSDVAAGASAITVTVPNDAAADAFEANQFADGYITIATGTLAADGVGQTFKVKSHPAAARNASCVLTLYDKIPVEIDVSEGVTYSLVASPWSKVVISPAAAAGTGRSIGWPLVAVTAAYYAWFQTKGILGALLDSDVVAGNPLVKDGSTAGAITTQVVNAGYLLVPTVAHAYADADTGEYGLVDACIN